MEDIQILCEIQAKLKAPKNQRNSFGNYNYRSCEDILEAVKPLLHEKGLSIVINDEIIMLGDRYYVKATAEILNEKQTDLEIITTRVASSSAYAREPETKKGMDASQITGATSSYARKYALNGLFAIDDTKDADTMDNRPEDRPKQEEKKPKPGGVTESNSPVIDTMLSVINMITDKDTGHKWKKDNQAAIDKLGSDKGKVMTAYFNKMKEFDKE